MMKMNNLYNYIGIIELDNKYNNYFYIVQSKETDLYYQADISNIGIYAVSKKGFEELQDLYNYLELEAMKEEE